MTSVVAFAAGKVVSAVSAVNAFYSEVNPATLSGAIDVVVVQYPDGELVCSPFHVRFGKLKLLRPHDKAVEVSVNGEVTELLMKVGEAGEAFFVVETENPVPSEYATSPIQQPQAVDSSMEVLDLDAPAVDGPTVVGPNGEALSPTAYGYVSAHGSDIEEDEYPVTDASQGATIEVKPDGKLDASNHSLAAPTTPNMAHSSKSSNKGSELPIDADDVVQSYAHDAAMMGIPSKSSRNYRKKSADVNVSDLISKAVSDFTDSPTNPSPVTHGSDTFSPASNPANLAIPETRTRRRRASHSSVSSDLPIDAEDVAQSFAADANLVGMTQSSVDKNPDVNGIVETTPIVKTDSIAVETSGSDRNDEESQKEEEPGLPPVPEHTPTVTKRLSASSLVAELPGKVMSSIKKGADALMGHSSDEEPHSDVEEEASKAESRGAPIESSQVETQVERDPSPILPTPVPQPPAVKEAEPVNEPVLLEPKPIISAVPTFVTPPVELPPKPPSEPAELDPDLDKPRLTHSQSFPVANLAGENKRIIAHSRASSMQIISEMNADYPVEDPEANPAMPGSYVKRVNTGPLSDTEVEYSEHEKQKMDEGARKGWSWRWGGLPKKPNAATEALSPEDARLRRERTKSAEPLSSMSVDEKVNNYLAGLPDSKGKESPVTPAGGDPTSHGDISPEPSVANAQSPERSSTPLHPERPLSFEGPISFAFNADIQMEVSACGYDKIRSLGTEEAEDLFQKNLVPFETVVKTPDALSDPTLVYKINGNYYSWAVAGPMIVANLAYRKPLPESAAQRLHHQHHPASPGQSTADNKRYSFIPLKGWWGRTNSTKTVTQLEGTSKDNLVDEGERPAGAIVEEESQDVKSQSPRGSPEPEATSPVVGKFPLKFAKSLRLTSEQLRSLNLKKGPNTITFAVPQSGASVTAKLFLFHHDCRIVISDIDGTITKSDALGHIFTMVGKDWTHLGIASLYTNIRNNGYHILYLTSRAIGQASSTREYLSKVEQGGYQLPEGPVIMSPDRLFASFHREVILRKPEEFKMACLRDIKRLFGERTPFYAGFGNRITDAMSYRSVDVPASRIFTIDPAGDVKLELLAEYKSSYVKLNDIVDQIFPPINDGSVVAPEFNDWNYWKEALPKIELPMDAGDALSDNSSFDSGDDEGYEDDGGADNDDFTEDGSEPDSNRFGANPPPPAKPKILPTSKNDPSKTLESETNQASTFNADRDAPTKGNDHIEARPESDQDAAEKGIERVAGAVGGVAKAVVEGATS